jgi:hypothetical protein
VQVLISKASSTNQCAFERLLRGKQLGDDWSFYGSRGDGQQIGDDIPIETARRDSMVILRGGLHPYCAIDGSIVTHGSIADRAVAASIGRKGSIAEANFD